VPSLLPGPLGSFYAYDAFFAGGVSVAAASDNGVPELITGAGPGGGPHVKVFGLDGLVLAQFYAYDPGFAGGVSVAAADLNGDGRADIVTGPGQVPTFLVPPPIPVQVGPEVKIIDGAKLGQLQNNAEIATSALLADFLAYDAS